LLIEIDRMKTFGLVQFAAIAAALSIAPDVTQAQLERAQDPSGVVVIQATQPNGVAFDCADPECSSGPVAKAIVAALADRNITIAGLFDRVRTGVTASTKFEQIPWLTTSAPIEVPLSANTARSSALVIGNGAYERFPRLAGSPRDGKAVADSLERLGFTTRTLVDADGKAVDTAIDDFVRGLQAGDTAVLYYSGHGFSVNGKGYLPPLAGDPAQLDMLARSSIAVETLIGALAGSAATRRILILDTHYPEITRSDAR
jgi:uncharacterized caspase-like protein